MPCRLVDMTLGDLPGYCISMQQHLYWPLGRNSGLCHSIGKTMACLQGNQFGVFFERAAEKVGAAFRHTGFDSSVIQAGALSITLSSIT